MKKTKQIYFEQNLKRDLIFDYINLFLVLIFGYFLNSSGTNFIHTIYFFLLLLSLSSSLKIILSSILNFFIRKNKGLYFFKFWYGFGISIFICANFFILFNEIEIHNLINTLVLSPFVLFANRKSILTKNTNDLNTLNMVKIFLITIMGPFIILFPVLFTKSESLEKISFLISYFVLCFPYKKTYNFFISDIKKQQLLNFFTNERKVFGLFYIIASIIVHPFLIWVAVSSNSLKALLILLITFVSTLLIGLKLIFEKKEDKNLYRLY